jgi:surface protein
MSYMFSECTSLPSLNLSNFNTNNVNNMSGMFYNCSSLTFLNLCNFNTNNVKCMDWMFFGLKKGCDIIITDSNLAIFK